MKKELRNRRNNRLKNHDYSQNGYYYITICTQRRIHWFGSIKNSKIDYSLLGSFANVSFENIPNFYSRVSIDEYVVMPNHVHGIIHIENSVGTEHCSVPTNIKYQSNTNTYGLISKIVKSFKNTITTYARNSLRLNSFQWQRSYFDHIIRNEQSLMKIREYIKKNPNNWEEDSDNVHLENSNY